ncbi:MAG: hypothetical protein D6784_14150 [Chloroflexi bacterium]|nr:MAG: hypothetical protein D6784_14150 [Chloroflexota bacterium]
MTKPSAFFDLQQAFQEAGCPFCRLLNRTADQYIDGVLWELVNDPDIRQELSRSRGYCPRHAWLLVRHGASLGAAILMEEVITTLLDLLAQARFDPPPPAGLGRLFGQRQTGGGDALADELSPQTDCPVCALTRTTEARYIRALLDHLPELLPYYQNSHGLCLPHFRQVLRQTQDPTTFNHLRRAQQAAWKRLQHHLREFIRKNDHNVREPFGVEGDSWLRAIEAIAGARPPRGV